MKYFLLFLIILTSQLFSNTCFLPHQAGQAYNGGNQVSHQGKNYQAKWWTTSTPPSFDWQELGNCQEANNKGDNHVV